MAEMVEKNFFLWSLDINELLETFPKEENMEAFLQDYNEIK